MNRDDIQKLLGGYATGTLTAEEQQVLFEAALDDQELFDAMVREQALRDVLCDPASKAQLLAALDEKPLRWYQKLMVHWRPLVGVAAMAGVGALAVGVWQMQRPAKPVLSAKLNMPAPVERPDAYAPPAVANEPKPPSPMSKSAAPQPAGPAQAPASGNHVASNRPTQSAAAPQRQNAPETDQPLQKEIASSKPKDSNVSEPRVPSEPAGSFGAGFRPSPPAGGVGNGRLAAGQDLRGGTGGNEKGAAAPAAPPAVKSEVQATKPLQSAPTQAAPSQTPFPQGQQGQQQSREPVRAQLEQSPQAPPPVTAPPSKERRAEQEQRVQNVDGISTPDARTLFYSTVTNPSPGGRSGDADSSRTGRSLGGFSATSNSARKKAAPSGAGAAATVSTASDKKSAPNLGVRYNLLRKNSEGIFAEVTPAALKSGDILELQLMPNDAGTLIISARAADGSLNRVLSQSVQPHQSYITPPLPSGVKEVQVMLMRQPPAQNAKLLRDEKADVSKQQVSAEPATYVVGGVSTAVLQFTIPLNYQ